MLFLMKYDFFVTLELFEKGSVSGRHSGLPAGSRFGEGR